MAKVLITGGAGFIGSHTVRKLLDQGEEVAVYDFFHQYIFPMQPTFLENMQYRFDVLLKGAQILRGSTDNQDELRRQVLAINPDYIIHLAALPLANIALRQSEEAFNSIVRGTVNMLEILRDMSGVQKFVYVSSSMIYGDFAQAPMPEDGAKDPKEIYGGMKLAGEILVKVFSKRYGIPYAIVRPSAVYGPTDNNRRVLQIFVESAILGLSITVVNPDTTCLDFSFVEDVAQGISLVTQSRNATNEDLNITRGEGRSLGEAVQILRGLFPNLQADTKIEEQGYRPERGALDISKARKLVGYNPSYSLEAGLEKYVAFVLAHNPSLRAQGDHG
jgi:nucleoside-diphosphate-sugar epimerase